MALVHGRTLRTVTGRTLEPARPDPSVITIRDIARGLANSCRFAGQLPVFYSVAQHSIHAAEQVGEAGGSAMAQLHALLHDSPEAYITDLPRPLKESMPPQVRTWWTSLEHGLLSAIYLGLGIPAPTEEEQRLVKAADETMLVTEDLYLRNLVQFSDPQPLARLLTVWSPRAAEACFLDLYAHLWKELEP